MCGIDIGGTDIKMALSLDNDIICFKEYDWYPASHSVISMTIEPILLLVRLIVAKATFNKLGGDANTKKMLDNALDKHASLDDIKKCVIECEKTYAGNLQLLDGIGMCFPDVVVENKIVGGEVSKVRGIRENENVNFEEEFSQLSDLNLLLQKYCKDTGVVKITNDGPMASYTAAVEIAYGEGEDKVINGVFAHTLGTELGTGWVDESGHIPEIPLEAYNYVINLGCYEQRKYEHDDLRSVNNLNTDIPGTVQKYGSQSGVFRFALNYFENERKDLYNELFEKGFVVHKNGGLYVPTEPVDLRKPFLEHVLSLPERENCPLCERIFTEIGEHLAVTWIETEKILCPKEKSRVLFGRVVKNKRCFELIQEGAKKLYRTLSSG